MKNLFLFIASFMMAACNHLENTDSLEKWKNEIIKAELQFSEMSKTEGISKAFIAFSAEDVVMNRGNKLLIGKEALKAKQTEKTSPFKKVTLTWKPGFVDVSASGDLGYTYGKFIYVIDSAGTKTSEEGIFHTVWKRQKDGTWKFVWD